MCAFMSVLLFLPLIVKYDAPCRNDCFSNVGRPPSYVQKKKTIYPEWNSCFDAHLYDGRIVQLIVMQRPSNTMVAETDIAASALADKCGTNSVAAVWVMQQSSAIITYTFASTLTRNRTSHTFRSFSHTFHRI